MSKGFQLESIIKTNYFTSNDLNDDQASNKDDLGSNE